MRVGPMKYPGVMREYVGAWVKDGDLFSSKELRCDGFILPCGK